jgi:2C-methyl-D-erythritol 2,4-cyclodiphosphate synthase
MCLAVRRFPAERHIAMASVDSDIRDFLAGKNDGEIVLHALYDHVLDEPVPQFLRDVLRD